MSLRVPDAEFIPTIISSVPTLGNVGPTERRNYSHQRDKGLINKGRGQIPVSIQSQPRKWRDSATETEAGYQTSGTCTQTQQSRQRATEDRFRWTQMEPEPGLGTERLSS